jgi:hypothetical protein
MFNYPQKASGSSIDQGIANLKPAKVWKSEDGVFEYYQGNENHILLIKTEKPISWPFGIIEIQKDGQLIGNEILKNSMNQVVRLKANPISGKIHFSDVVNKELNHTIILD